MNRAGALGQVRVRRGRRNRNATKAAIKKMTVINSGPPSVVDPTSSVAKAASEAVRHDLSSLFKTLVGKVPTIRRFRRRRVISK
jgi:hypothetical protein